MTCSNVHDCVCPKTTCPNYRKCCDCVANHRSTGSLPTCYFPDNGGDKSFENFYRKLKKEFES